MSVAVRFQVASANPMLASTRYRALMPAIGLEKLGYACEVSGDLPSDDVLRGLSCLIFAKAFRDIDVDTARRTDALGVPIVLDACDHMFFPEYGDGRGDAYAAAFREMASLAREIVTTGPALADVLRELAPETPISIIPDQLETPALLAQILSRAQRSQTRWTDRAAFALRDPERAARRALAHVSARLAPTRASAPPPPENDGTTLIWFGNHGAGHSAFGIGALEAVLPALKTLAQRHKIRLLMVSNSREKFERTLAHLPFPTEYREWSATRIFADLAEAKICLMPIPDEPFARCKSANRAMLALSCGAAIVADDFPALADFRDCIAVNDWQSGIERYLTDEHTRAQHVAAGRDIIERSYSAEPVAKLWQAVIERARADGTR